MNIQLFNQPCFDAFKNIEDQSVDMVCVDPPYGTTGIEWDKVLDFKIMWAELERIVKPNGNIIIFGSQPFTSLVIVSKIDWFRHELIWNKNKCGSPGLSKYRPQKVHENIMVFSKQSGGTYNPIMEEGGAYSRIPKDKEKGYGSGINSHGYGFSNKGHHGYIGDSYIGAWCNLGAGTSCSNLKNTVGRIKIWDIETNSFILAEKKAGIFMGDYVKTSINTSFNSGTVIGICANIFEFAHLTEKFIPSFAWGGQTENRYELEKLLEEINKWMEMKGEILDKTSKEKIITLYLKSNNN
jgi:hypothetical protein